MKVSGVRLRPPSVELRRREACSQRCGGTGGDRCIFEPEVGKLFATTGEAMEFYNTYSWEIDFVLRFGRSRGEQDREAFQGHGGSSEVRSVRYGCAAMIRLVRQDDDSWAFSYGAGFHGVRFKAGFPGRGGARPGGLSRSADPDFLFVISVRNYCSPQSKTPILHPCCEETPFTRWPSFAPVSRLLFAMWLGARRP
ncbi:unnamed protein product [Urochloa humidicola]